jgi:hypothetical protein
VFKKLLPLLFLFAGFQANAGLITLDLTVVGSNTAMSTDLTFNYDDVNSDSVLAFSELSDIDWMQTFGVDSYSGTSTPVNVGSGGFDLTLSGGAVVSATGGSFVVNTFLGGIGLQTFSVADSILLWNHCGVSCGVRPSLSDFKVSAAGVPEPSITALFGLGLVGIGFARRRRS